MKAAVYCWVSRDAKQGEALKKRLYLVLMALFVLLNAFTLSCVNNDQAIKDAVTDFITAYQNQEYSRCLDYLSNRLRSSEGDQKLINRMQLTRLFSGSSNLKNIGQPSIDGKTAKVWIDIEGLLGFTNTVELSLIKEDGKWRIDGF